MPIFSAIAYIGANWKWLLGAAASLVLATLLAFTTIDRNQWRAAARKADATIAKFSDAQKQATIAAQTAHDAQEQRYKDLANAADQNHAAQTASADDAVARYIASHRVPACPTSGAAGSTAASAGRSDPESAVRPDSAPDMVAVTPGDIRVCTDNTLRLEAARDWAAGLNVTP